MLVFTKPIELDPIMLLIHESNSPLAQHPFNNRDLADAMNRALADAAGSDFAYIRMIEPEETGLSRWRLEWEAYGWPAGTYTADRGIRTPGEIRKELPYYVVVVLRKLSEKKIYLGQT